MPGLSCGMWDLVPWPGIEPGSPVLETWSLSHWTTREVPKLLFKVQKSLSNDESNSSLNEQDASKLIYQMLGSHGTPKYSLHFRSILWGLPGRSNKTALRSSLAVQWIRIRLSMQGTWVWSLVREDSTCLRATKPIHHIYGAWVLQLLKPKHSRACVLQQEKPPQWEAATKSSPYLPQLEKAHTHNKKPAQPKINFKTIKKKRKKKIHLAMQGMWVQSLPWLGN